MKRNRVYLGPLDIYGLSDAALDAKEEMLERELISWEGTPYKKLMQIKGKGVDCVRFVSAILDFLLRKKTEIYSLPRDAAMHNREEAFRCMRKLLRLYPSDEVEGSDIQPGDILICGPKNGGPGHAMIAGLTHLWHVGGTGVQRAGFVFSGWDYDNLFEIRRLKDRHLW